MSRLIVSRKTPTHGLGAIEIWVFKCRKYTCLCIQLRRWYHGRVQSTNGWIIILCRSIFKREPINNQLPVIPSISRISADHDHFLLNFKMENRILCAIFKFYAFFLQALSFFECILLLRASLPNTLLLCWWSHPPPYNLSSCKLIALDAPSLPS